MDEHVEFKTQCDTLVQIAGKEFSHVCSEDERWIVAERRIMKMARNGGPNAMRCLLGLLRKPDLPEQVADVVAKAMALCCGPCAAPPAVRTFIFSPSLTVQAPSVFPRVAVDEKFDWIVGSDLLYDLKSSLALAGVIRRRLLNSNSMALIVNPIREKDLLEHFLKELNRLGLTTNVEQVEQREWTNCKLATYGEDGVDDLDEYCTMYNMDHYEGGIVALHITLKNES